MVFSSLTFICIFLPAVFIFYRLLPSTRLQNALLLIASLVFYAYGEPVYVLLMCASALLNYLWALLISKAQEKNHSGKAVLVVSILQNLTMLGVYKYAGFAVTTVNSLLGSSWPVPQITLPIGISFFTFQALSYVIDVYRKEVKAQKNAGKVMLYIAFFPQLIAGPIVKYHDIEQELERRSTSASETAKGLRRFITGLSKKVLIANQMAVIADAMFAAPLAQINILGAWTGAIAYMLQIYFDFSGYSDMAIGLGRMFGFHFQENFNYPYISSSVREFWRRWHISLSGWFRDYLYIPLGGNRRGKARTVLNKYLVFACTGIWHGANVTFLFWGLFHGTFLMLEQCLPFFRNQGGPVKRFIGHIYTLLVVLIGFVFFRADSMRQGVCWVGRMFTGWQWENASMSLVIGVLTPMALVSALAGLIFCMPVIQAGGRNKTVQKASWILTPLLLALCMMVLAGGSYNPFIYFRF